MIQRWEFGPIPWGGECSEPGEGYGASVWGNPSDESWAASSFSLCPGVP